MTPITKEHREELREEIFNYFMDCFMLRILPAFSLIIVGVMIGRSIP